MRQAAICLMLCLPLTSVAITIGPGPVIGIDKAGLIYHEEFQDWNRADLRALDEWDSGGLNLKWWDGHDDGRDLVAFYSRLESGNLYLRVDCLDLLVGWQERVNFYIAIDLASGGAEWLPDFLDCRSSSPWEICLAIYADGAVPGADFNVYDADYSTGWNGSFAGSYANHELDAIECAIPQALLLAAGWDGFSPPAFQVATAKDFAEGDCSGGGSSSDLADAFVDDARGCDDGSLDGAIAGDAAISPVHYATIAHGNQPLVRGSDLRTHVYDTEAETGIEGGTGFVRTLDTHRIFSVPINLHLSGTLLSGLAWALSPSGASDPSDGPSLLDEIALFVDGDQADRPGALMGGVFAEHIMPYFEGAANEVSMAMADTLHADLFGLSAAEMGVMHCPERVLRSLSTGLTPLDGHGFEDILAGGYRATCLDAVGHLHHWFYPDETLWPDRAYRHRPHRINGVICFFINHREDQNKFWAQDEGLHLDTRRSLIDKAMGERQLVLVFDDWEALAGKSFGAEEGEMIPNDNPVQYHKTIRWIANHPWIEIATLPSLLALCDTDPGWVIDQGTRFDLPARTYPWLSHATEDSYHNWYYNDAGGLPGNEQSFYDLVPVIEGEQGDYHRRGVGPEADGPALPSQMPFGDLNTPGTLIHDTWSAISAAPEGRLRTLAEAAFFAMAYETAWHEEDNGDYSDSDGYGDWLYPDLSWDGMSTWALRLQNHIRDTAALAMAAAWADSVRSELLPPETAVMAIDVDLDGIDEILLRNRRLWTLWQTRGGRLLLAARFDQAADDARLLLGNPLTFPSAPGEEEWADAAASRCTGFKVMNGSYADEIFSYSPQTEGLVFTSPDGLITLAHGLPDAADSITTIVSESIPGPLYLRLGLSPGLRGLLSGGRAALSAEFDGGSPEGSSWYRLSGPEGCSVRLTFGTAAFNPAPLHSGFERRDLPQTEEVELFGDGSFTFTCRLGCEDDEVGLPPQGAVAPARLLPPFPNPANPTVRIAFSASAELPARLSIHSVDGRLLRVFPEAVSPVTWNGRDEQGRDLASGLYLLRLESGGSTDSQKVLLLR